MSRFFEAALSAVRYQLSTNSDGGKRKADSCEPPKEAS
jgi:hypothetical protein